MPQFLHVRARHLARHPSSGGNPLESIQHFRGRRRDLAVERHGGFECDQRRAVTNVAGECLIQPASLLFQTSDFNVHSRGSQFFKSLSADLWIRIRHRRHHAMDAGGNQRVGARRRASLMSMRFEVDVKRCPARFLARCFESEDLGVLHATIRVASAAHDVALSISDDRADVRIGRGQSQTLAREFQRAVKKRFVGEVRRHPGRNLTRASGLCGTCVSHKAT